MNKDTIAGIFLWFLGAVFVVIAALQMRVERWLLVRRVKKDMAHKEKNIGQEAVIRFSPSILNTMRVSPPHSQACNSMFHLRDHSS